ncbi:MAG TPA: DUF4149 domain-containing protein [Gemmatirosa sp.]|nr:DUF4149 domain-containing protein [Gemmatirosa sp.]
MSSSVRLLGAAAVLAAWIGAALLVAAVVAPAAFAVLPSRALAGAVVGRVLPVIFVGGIVAGAVAALLGMGAAPYARARLALPLVAAAACLVAQFVIGPKIQRLRAEMGPNIEALAPTDPRRAQFGKLHGFSVAWMGAGLLAAGAALVVTVLAAAKAPGTTRPLGAAQRDAYGPAPRVPEAVR